MATLEYSRVVAAGPGWTQVETPDGRTYTVKGDRAMRNNNPGNIEYGNFTRNQGAIGTDGRFAVFPDRRTGTRAQASLIFNSPSYRDLTLAQAIERYAPQFENNTAAYAAAVANAAGVSLDTKMRDIPAAKREAVILGMQAVEGNTAARAFDAFTGAHDYTIDATSPTMPTPSFNPWGANEPGPFSPSRVDNVFAAGPPGNFRVPNTNPFSQPVGQPFSGGILANRAMPSLQPAPVGKVTRGAPLSQPSPNRPDNIAAAGPRGNFDITPARLAAAPVGKVERAPLAPAQRAAPVARPAPLQAVPAGLVTRGPSLPSPGPAPSPARPDNLNAAGPKGMFSVPAPAPVDRSVAPANPGQLGGITMSNPMGLGGPGGIYVGKAPLSPMQQKAADAFAATQTPQAPAAPPPAPVIAPALAPTVPAPALTAPVNLQEHMIAGPFPDRPAAPPPRPSFTAADVYAGRAPQAMDNTGLNSVSRDAFGNTSVTNKYGATTVTLADGRQAAGSIAAPLDGMGIRSPNPGGFMDRLTSPEMGQAVKTAGMGGLGGLLGGLAGPAGALLGGLVGRELSKPGGGAIGGLLGNRNGGMDRFPSAPPTPSGGLRDPRGSNRSGESMRSISPAAARDIERGVGGLF